MTKEHLNVYIQKEDSIYLKGWAILIMVYLHVFGARAIDLPAYQSIHDVYIHGELLSYILSKFCSICVHLYILLSGYGFISYIGERLIKTPVCEDSSVL